MQLVLSIPQAALRPEGEVPIERWDDGITAFLLNYMANISETQFRQMVDTGVHNISSYIPV